MTRRDSRNDAEDVLQVLIVGGLGYREAGERVGLAESTVARRMARPEFRAEVDARRVEMLREASRLLGVSMVAAVRVLLTVAEDESAADGVRVRAAIGLLSSALRSREIDVSEMPRASARLGPYGVEQVNFDGMTPSRCAPRWNTFAMN